jgi:pilus assembly protein FimV
VSILDGFLSPLLVGSTRAAESGAEGAAPIGGRRASAAARAKANSSRPGLPGRRPKAARIVAGGAPSGPESPSSHVANGTVFSSASWGAISPSRKPQPRPAASPAPTGLRQGGPGRSGSAGTSSSVPNPAAPTSILKKPKPPPPPEPPVNDLTPIAEYTIVVACFVFACLRAY